jgi:hypothetical protein
MLGVSRHFVIASCMVTVAVDQLAKLISAIIGSGDILVCVDNCSQIYLASLDFVLQDWCYSDIYIRTSPLSHCGVYTNSSGFAGSMITASFDLSSTTR